MERYCTKCGKSTIKSNDSLFICGAGHQNWVNPAVGVSAYVIREGKVLFGVRSSNPGKGKLDVPGGFVEVYESAEQAAVREAKEEFGIDIAIRQCLGTYPGIYDGRPSLDIAFVATMPDQPITALDDLSGGEPVWRDLGNLPGPDEAVDQWVVAAQKDLRTWWQQNGN